MKLAVFLAILAAGGKLPKDPNELLRRVPLLGEGGPLDELTGDIRGRLIDAGKTAAMTAASNRIDSLSDKLEQRTAMMRGAKPPTRPASEEPREEADEYGAARARPRERGRPASPEEREEYEYEEPEERRPRARSRQGMTR
jgi:hypothetical protein